MIMKVKCLRQLDEIEKAIDEVSRFLLQESYYTYSEDNSVNTNHYQQEKMINSSRRSSLSLRP
jgi:hypothetical protein